VIVLIEYDTCGKALLNPYSCKQITIYFNKKNISHDIMLIINDLLSLIFIPIF